MNRPLHFPARYARIMVLRKLLPGNIIPYQAALLHISGMLCTLKKFHSGCHLKRAPIDKDQFHCTIKDSDQNIGGGISLEHS
jgi:hypothetical protein